MEFQNHLVGSFTNPNPTAEYVAVWFDETLVREFGFVSVGLMDVLGRYHRVHSVSVEARYVFDACAAFSTSLERR